MKNVRLFFAKTGRLKFVSHLDMTRFMSRLIKKSNIPIWYTEGFNQHIYMNFALPLSLGYESFYEVMDFRLIDEEYRLADCLEALRRVAPPDIDFIALCEPKTNMKEIGFAEYKLCFEDLSVEKSENLKAFLERDSILCEKKCKKGKIKQIDIIPKIKSFSLIGNELTLCLTAGNEDNLNPSLVLSAFFEQTNTEPIFYTVTRISILDKELNKFE